MHRYVPDFIVRIDDGGDDLVNLVVEIKGLRGEDAKIKAETMRASWVPGVNRLKDFGRWDFVEFKDVHRMEDDFHRWFSQCAISSAVRAAHGLIARRRQLTWSGVHSAPKKRSGRMILVDTIRLGRSLERAERDDGQTPPSGRSFHALDGDWEVSLREFAQQRG